MAAAYCNDRYNKENAPIRASASSAGLYGEGSPINPMAVSALLSAGVLPDRDNMYKDHISHTVSREDVDSADAIICMDGQIAAFMEKLFPSSADKILPFPFPVIDPYGGDEQTYTECLVDIASQIDGILTPYGEDTDADE